MLWNASSLIGFTVEAIDGPVGTVQDLLLDTIDWVIRWIIIDTGGDASDRTLYLPASALSLPDVASRGVHVSLTTQRIRSSPAAALDMPVTRQVEEMLYQYYESAVQPSGKLIPAVDRPPINGTRNSAGVSSGDIILRRSRTIMKLHISAADGHIGHIDDFLVQDGNWIIRYIVIDTGNWWPGEKVLMSPRAIQTIDWEAEMFHLKVNRARVKDSPAFDPTITAGGAYDEEFLTYFGVNWVKK